MKAGRVVQRLFDACGHLVDAEWNLDSAAVSLNLHDESLAASDLAGRLRAIRSEINSLAYRLKGDADETPRPSGP